MMFKKTMLACALAAALMAMSAASAFAHVTVWPKEAAQGAYEVFTVRVPSETEGTETVAVRVVFPEGVSVTRFEPKQGWTAELERNADGAIAAVTWAAEEGFGLEETEFTEFRMSGRVLPEAEGQLIWKAYQTYADGSVAEWVGAPDTDSPNPAPVTAVVPGSGEGDGHGHAGAGESPAAAESGAEASSEGGSNDTLTLALAVAAFVLAALALVLTLTRKRRS